MEKEAQKSNIDELIFKPVNLDAITNERINFIINNNNVPDLIVMNPVDGSKFKELVCREFRPLHVNDFVSFYGMKLKQSIDVEQGKWYLH